MFSTDLWWTDGGRSFAVDRQGFKEHIMNVFFDERKFRSFQTLLHKYGFYSVLSIHNSMTDVIVYSHEMFVQDDIELCRLITRAQNRRSSAAMFQQQHDKETKAPRRLSEMTQETEPSTDVSDDDDDELMTLAQGLSDVEPIDDDDWDCCSLSGLSTVSL
jgi:Ran GTPase-activating protein (RanGAP) involved in mRNA processing and transport